MHLLHQPAGALGDGGVIKSHLTVGGTVNHVCATPDTDKENLASNQTEILSHSPREVRLRTQRL